MRNLFNLFLDICLFRKGPQDVPASIGLLKICMLGYALSNVLVLLLNTPAEVAILQVVVDLVLLVGFLYLALRWCQHPRRFTQTLSALAGIGMLMSVLALPLMIWIVGQDADGDIVLPSLFLLGLIAWSIAIMAHILRYALDTPVWVGTLCALGYTFLSWTIIGWIN